MKALLIFLFSTSAFAGAWVKAPGGKLPDPKSEPVTTFVSEALCGSNCVDIAKPDGSLHDIEIVDVQSGKVVESQAKKQAKTAREAAEKEAADLAIKTRRDLIKAAKTATTVAELRSAFIALLEELKLDK